ncbi:MAG: hypothetical protein US61_C0045G0004 [Parcubacteria group bacterium GW2011_GWE2_37_8]|nr:MAG: hypothetical protein US61_C0045G0004 [Parcubacteria group bacterium GW2011_GWE2_37_8]
MALVFDIETIGENFDKLDVTTQESLTRWIRKESQNEEEYRAALEDMKNGLGFSPLTGEIVVIGVFDSEKDKGAIYYQAPGQKNKDFEDNGIVYRQCAEKERLEKFWEGAKQYNEFISFNGRAFDVPFIIVRSAVHGIRPTKDLMYNRYINSQRSNAVHIDLLDQLSFYGTVRKKGNLHLWCRAFGIASPKVEGVTGDDVGRLFKEKEFVKIAKYNSRDLFATRDLYEHWRDYIRA